MLARILEFLEDEWEFHRRNPELILFWFLLAFLVYVEITK